jgi:hypothetical protein
MQKPFIRHVPILMSVFQPTLSIVISTPPTPTQDINKIYGQIKKLDGLKFKSNVYIFFD